MLKRRFWAVVLILLSIGIGYLVVGNFGETNGKKFKLGLDLNGGTELVYKADLSNVTDVKETMAVLQRVIERRVNAFGVSEPVIQVEKVGIGAGATQQLIVELPGEDRIDQAIALIGQTPTLEFRLVRPEYENATSTEGLTAGQIFFPAELTGKYLKKSELGFNSTVNEYYVGLQFDTAGSELFAKITRENVNKPLAIFLDGEAISMPVIREEIRGGQASINGGYIGSKGRKEATELVNNLNLGALPVPIELISSQNVGASLGAKAVADSVKAGQIAFLIIALFLIAWYRVPGIIATVALAIYVILNLALFKFLPGPLQVTLTAAGMAGFILSIGMAVDANILIFERMKEELKAGRELGDAIREGFARAWLSIRDSNTSSLITAAILFFFSSTAVVKGFAYVFGLGVLVSMFTAVTATRTLLFAVNHDKAGKFKKFLFSCGLSK